MLVFFAIVCLVISYIYVLSSCHNQSPVKRGRYCDSAIIEDYNYKFAEQFGEIVKLEDSLCLYKDSINKYKHELDSVKDLNDTLRLQLFVAEYKLDRIGEYNRIAGQGNNITFLRGWINRVLND